MKRQDEGFTLIELLIVIVILGILATIVVFAVSGIRDQGDEAACDTEGRAISTAIEAYYAANDEYPASDADISSYFRNSAPQYMTITAGGASYPTVALNSDAPPDCVVPSETAAPTP